MYKVIITDDHVIVREGLKMALGFVNQVASIREAGNGQELLDMLQEESADLIFMDINMPVMDGVEATKKALAMQEDVKIITLTSFDNLEYVHKMLDMGISGYLLKDADYTEIETAIKVVMSGKNYFTPSVLMKLTQETVSQRDKKHQQEKLPQLTEREMHVLKLIAQGLSKHEIAEKMFISERTVDKYKEKLMSKTATNSTLNLVLYAIKKELVIINAEENPT